jgi:hypothetical protein
MRYLDIMKYSIALLLAFVALCMPAMGPPPSHAADTAALERERIHALLETLERSGHVFIRNGSAHSARDARAHLEMKLDRAGDRVTTAEQFIDRLAARSSSTGRPYLIRLADGSTVEAGAWLRARLAEIDATSKAAKKGAP